MGYPQPWPARFWKYVVVKEPTDCWLWTGYSRDKRYGCIRYPGTFKQTPAHRIAWELTHGSIPSNLIVCHTCDNGFCCNVQHLFLGTHQDNTDDKVKKKRHSFNEQHPNAKLTIPQVTAIRMLATPGILGSRKIAKQFDVTRSTIQAVLKKRTWKGL